MIEIGEMKITEISKMTGISTPVISKYFKGHNDSQVTRVNNRIVGVNASSVEEYFKKSGLAYFYKPAVILSANLCGGVGKTSTIYNLGVALRRITNEATPIVFVDGDSQASLTSIVLGKPADDNELILIDFLEGKASLDDILTEVGKNIWFIKSNLNQAWIDKVLTKPQDVKKGMLKFYQAIFEKLGKNAKIFQDHTPQLSSLFASSVCALNQLDDNILKSVIIPIRSDKFAIQGGDYIIREIEELRDTFSLSDKIDIHCFFSSIDRRISTTGEALKVAQTKKNILKHLSPAVIRYSAEIPKSIMNSSNVYSKGKNNNAAQDYQDLLQFIFSSKGG